MRRLNLVFLQGTLSLVLWVPFVFSKEKSKTGVFDKNLFTDSAYGYTTSFSPNWKGRAKDEPSLIRLALEKSEVQINPRFAKDRASAGTRPRFIILADTTSLSLEEFLGRLFGEEGWKRKKEFLKVLDWQATDREVARTKVNVAGQEGIQVTFLRNMWGHLQQQEGVLHGAEGQNVSEGRIPTTAGGSEMRAEIVTFFRKGKEIFVTALFSSQFFLESNFKETVSIFSDWKYLDREKSLDSSSTAD